jgi:hypothetical protein
MLQVLHLNVSKVDQVLHLPPRFLLSRLGVFSSSSLRRLGVSHLLPFSIEHVAAFSTEVVSSTPVKSTR